MKFLLILLTLTSFAQAAPCIPVGILGEFQSASSRASFPYGTEMIRGTAVAIDEAKGQCVRTFEIDINNSISNIEGRIKKYSREYGIKYFIGLGTSAQVHASIKGIDETGSVLFSPTATDDEIIKRSKNIVLMSPTNHEMLLKVISEVKKMGLKKASIIYGENDIYSRSMAQEFRKLALKVGMQITFEKGIRTGRNTKIEKLNIEALNTSDFLFLPVFELDVIKILGYLHAKGFTKKVVGTDSWGSNSKILKTLTPSVVSQLLFSITAYMTTDLKVRENPFFRSYEKRFKQEPIDISAFSYEAMKLILQLNSKCQSYAECLNGLKGFAATTGEMIYDQERRVFKRDIFLRTYE